MLKNFWYVAEQSENVSERPVHVRMLGQDFVLFRDASGGLACLSDICVHRGAALSQGKVKDGCVECPYHGWRYDASGACVKIPAQPDKPVPKKARVDSYPVQEKYGWVWVFLGDLPEAERPPLPEFPEFHDPAWRCIYGHWDWDADYARVVENGLDFAHAPFVHEGAFGDPERAAIEAYDVQEHEWGANATAVLEPPQPKGIWKLLRMKRTPVEATTGFHMTGAVMRLHVVLNAKMQMVILDANTPIDAHRTRTFWISCRNFFTGGWADGDARKRTLKIFRQDDRILSHVKPERLPFDLSEELSVKSDALQIAFRKKRKEFIRRGWCIDSERIEKQIGGKHAVVIPSPARLEERANGVKWVLNTVPVYDGRDGDPLLGGTVIEESDAAAE